MEQGSDGTADSTIAHEERTSKSRTRKITRESASGMGKSFIGLTGAERRSYASIQLMPKKDRPAQPCPFLSKKNAIVNCWKPGGICSLRSYEKSGDTGIVTIDSRGSSLRATCPSRFEEGNTIYGWIGEALLEDISAVGIGETPFLERVPLMEKEGLLSARSVGRIDNVLVVPASDPLHWCPVEKQAVYFSGEKMGLEFAYIAEFSGEAIPFPTKNRRPDYRSSGPKRCCRNSKSRCQMKKHLG